MSFASRRQVSPVLVLLVLALFALSLNQAVSAHPTYLSLSPGYQEDVNDWVFAWSVEWESPHPHSGTLYYGDGHYTTWGNYSDFFDVVGHTFYCPQSSKTWYQTLNVAGVTDNASSRTVIVNPPPC